MDCDVLIVGGGPAGMTAAIYLARAGFQTILLDPSGGGGLASTTDMIHNYPGFPGGVSGFGLMESMAEQAKAFGARIMYGEVLDIRRNNGSFFARTSSGEYVSRAVIYAAGTTPRKLGVPGEGELMGKGVSFCATCDGPLYKDKVVAVVGGGDSALTETEFLTRFARKVILIHRRDRFRAGQAAIKRIEGHPKIDLMLSSIVTEIRGDGRLTSVLVKNLVSNQIREISVDGLFLYIGWDPNVAPIRHLVDVTESGHVRTGEDMSTKTPGLFVAGDIRHKPFRQVATAVGDGANAAWSSERFLMEEGEYIAKQG